jgi:hypothetical protein
VSAQNDTVTTPPTPRQQVAPNSGVAPELGVTPELGVAPELGVVIISWNVKDLLDRCLLSLREIEGDIPARITVWVVDNASADGSTALVRDRHPWVHLEALEENLGYVRGNNLILDRFLSGALAMPDYVWLLNPDTVVTAEAVRALLNCFQTHPCAGLVGPELLNPDGSRQTCAFRFPGLLQPLFDLGLMPQRFYHSRLNGRYPEALFRRGAPFRIDHPLGAAMMARAAALRAVGALDPRFFMYCEEIDWAWRMRQAGWSTWLVPAAKVVHYGGASTRQARPETTAHLWESRAKLYHKHRGPLVRRIVGAVVRRTFAQRTAPSPAWDRAHRRIQQAWEF